MKVIADQPAPKPGKGEPLWERVQERFRLAHPPAGPDVVEAILGDMRERDRLGRERYGTPLLAFNGRDQLVDAYQEVLDARVYVEAAVVEGRLSGARASDLPHRIDSLLVDLRLAMEPQRPPARTRLR